MGDGLPVLDSRECATTTLGWMSIMLNQKSLLSGPVHLWPHSEKARSVWESANSQISNSPIPRIQPQSCQARSTLLKHGANQPASSNRMEGEQHRTTKGPLLPVSREQHEAQPELRRTRRCSRCTAETRSRFPRREINLIGVVTDWEEPRKTRGPDLMTSSPPGRPHGHGRGARSLPRTRDLLPRPRNVWATSCALHRGYRLRLHKVPGDWRRWAHASLRPRPPASWPP